LKHCPAPPRAARHRAGGGGVAGFVHGIGGSGRAAGRGVGGLGAGGGVAVKLHLQNLRLSV